ncbi:hypothetical protein T484DRAFT_1748650 [Baffinella frigidus]|nr:hypothetical protein T484DRAFT_1748650 [Cryptophyta sp. CCMP2293]
MAAFGVLPGDPGLEEIMAELNDTQVHPAEAEALQFSSEEAEEEEVRLLEDAVQEVSNVPPHGSADDECRICRGGWEVGPLLHPCKCSGSIRFVHAECQITYGCLLPPCLLCKTRCALLLRIRGMPAPRPRTKRPDPASDARSV